MKRKTIESIVKGIVRAILINNQLIERFLQKQIS